MSRPIVPQQSGSHRKIPHSCRYWWPRSIGSPSCFGIAQPRAGRATNAALYALNTVFVLLYIASTYDLPVAWLAAIRTTEVGLAVVFLGEYGIRIRAADDPWTELTNPYTVLDLLAVVPVLVTQGIGIGFLRGLHTLRIFRFLRLLIDEQQLLGRRLSIRAVRRLELSVTIFLIFFLSTGFIYAVEGGVNPAISNFGDAFYYTVIAVSTVGFGDIIPVTAAGRWITVLAVLVGFVLIPWQRPGFANRRPTRLVTTARAVARLSPIPIDTADVWPSITSRDSTDRRA